MRLVLTLLVRDEADVVDTHVAFHLNAGIDYIIATDHRSHDGTTEVLERYAREGHLQLIREEDPEYRESEWRTRMARMAATDLEADWVIHSDGDEFWWPRGRNLKEALAAIPSRYGLVRAFWRPFVPRHGESFFAERMTVRLSGLAAINNPLSQFRPNAKVIHRADSRLVVRRGNHAVEGVSLRPLRGWFPIEVFHFPFRSLEQAERKASIYRATKETRLHDAHRRMHGALERGRLADLYQALAIDDATLDRGLADGSLAVDTRLRDALRTMAGSEVRVGGLALPSPSATDVAYAVERSALAEADAVRLQRRVDELRARIGSLERRGGAALSP
jgi:glycosyl transferase family 2